MDGINYPSVSLGSGDAISLPIPPIGNATGYGTNIPGQVVSPYSSLSNNGLPGYGVPDLTGFPESLQSGINAVSSATTSIGSTAKSYIDSANQAVINAVPGAATVQATGDFLTSLTISRIATIIIGLLALGSGFFLLGSTSLTDAVRSLKPIP
jgi:hypothetical protein